MEASAKNAYTYNGKELNADFDLDWLDLPAKAGYGARWYDASLGRFHTIDRFTEKYNNLNGYHYTVNNPINAIEMNGDSVIVLIAPSGAGGARHVFRG